MSHIDLDCCDFSVINDLVAVLSVGTWQDALPCRWEVVLVLDVNMVMITGFVGVFISPTP